MSRLNCIGLMLLMGLAFRLDASSFYARAECGGGGLLQGQNDAQQTSVPNQFVTATIPDACTATASASYSTFKLGTNAGGFAYPPDAAWTGGRAKAEVLIWFGLIDPSRPANAPGTIYLPINYDLTLSAGSNQFAGVGSSAAFLIVDPSNPFTRLLDLVSGQPDTSKCPNRIAAFPACNGRYQGTVTYAIDVQYNTGSASNRVYLDFIADSLDGSVDATHTVTFGNIILPTGVSFSYDSSIGNDNPLGFTAATATSAIPEPATIGLLTAGLLSLAAFRLRIPVRQ